MFSFRSRAASLGRRKMPGRAGIIGIVVASFFLGIGAGWFTWFLPRVLVAAEPSASVAPVASPTPSLGPVVPVDLFPPIERPLSNDDVIAGLTDLDIEAEGSGSFVIAPGVDEPEGDGPVRWVRIELEEGLPLDPEALSTFVMGVLNDERGWGAGGRLQFARTDGAAEIRIIFANPLSVEGLCPDPHTSQDSEVSPPQVTATDPSPSVSPTTSAGPLPSPTVSAAPPVRVCADQGLVVVDTYRWAAGLEAFEDDRPGARTYLLMHFLGHALGEDDAMCEGTDVPASVMVDHQHPVEPCTPNAWPHTVAASGA